MSRSPSRAGELRAIIGPNGAGKTTFFNLITGFFPPSAGEIVFDGRPVTRLSAQQRVKLGMGRTFQVTEIFPELTVRENVRIAVEVGAGYGLRPWLGQDAAEEVRREVGRDRGAGRSRRPRPTGWWARWRMAISAPPRSRWRSR